jgi:hypothetical protein
LSNVINLSLIRNAELTRSDIRTITSRNFIRRTLFISVPVLFCIVGFACKNVSTLRNILSIFSNLKYHLDKYDNISSLPQEIIKYLKTMSQDISTPESINDMLNYFFNSF